jgi:hypothetical protein
MKTITVPVKITMTNLDDGDSWTLTGFADDVSMTQEGQNGYWSTTTTTLDEAVKIGKNIHVNFKWVGQTLKFVTPNISPDLIKALS